MKKEALFWVGNGAVIGACVALTLMPVDAPFNAPLGFGGLAVGALVGLTFNAFLRAADRRRHRRALASRHAAIASFQRRFDERPVA